MTVAVNVLSKNIGFGEDKLKTFYSVYIHTYIVQTLYKSSFVKNHITVTKDVKILE